MQLSTWKKILLSISIFIFLGMFGLMLWGIYAPAVGPTASALLLETQDIRIEDTGTSLIFSPEEDVQIGFIFYPGARVRPASYTPEMIEIARAGYLVIIPYMPFNFAAFAPNTATDIRENFPSIESWVLGGHSLGGAMAASYTAKNPGLIEGLIFWASYPPKSANLSHLEIPITSIFAEFDGLATPIKIGKYSQYLPRSTKYHEIMGGNHAQFGDYGVQFGDNEAIISPERQWEEVTEFTLEALGKIKQ